MKTFEVVTLPKKRAKRITRHAVLDLLSVAVNIGQNLEDASNKTGDARRALIESAYDWAKALLREIEGIDIS